MVVHGRVQKGVVVLDEGVSLPEGLEVAVIAPGAAPAVPTVNVPLPHSVLDIAPVKLGLVREPLTGFDLLGEMLEGRS